MFVFILFFRKFILMPSPLYWNQVSMVFWGNYVKWFLLGAYLDTIGTSIEGNNCFGSKTIEIMTFLFRIISCPKCGMARYQHIIKSLANMYTLTPQSRRVSLRSSVLTLWHLFPGPYPDKPGYKRLLLTHHNEAQVPEGSTAKAQWSWPRIDATEHWKQDSVLLSSPAPHH